MRIHVDDDVSIIRRDGVADHSDMPFDSVHITVDAAGDVLHVACIMMSAREAAPLIAVLADRYSCPDLLKAAEKLAGRRSPA